MGRGSDEFYLAAKIDGYNPVTVSPTSASRAHGSISSAVFKAQIRELSPNTDFSVRVSAATRSAWSECSCT